MTSSAIDLVLDVGGHVGNYGGELRENGYTGAIISFEPRLAAFARLNGRASSDPKWTVHNTGLARESGTVDINIAGNGASSSMLEMTEQHLAIMPESDYRGKETVIVRRLDDVELPDAKSVMLKLDVQGFEAEVLGGATDTVGRARLIECELCIVELYRGQPLILDMLSLLKGLGFRLVDLEPAFHDRLSGAIVALDGLFVGNA